MFQEGRLLLKELLELDRLNPFASTAIRFELPKFRPDALFQDLQAVLAEVVVEFGEIRDRTDSRQHCVIRKVSRLRPEGSDAGDAFLRAKGPQSLMSDVATLENNGTALSLVNNS